MLHKNINIIIKSKIYLFLSRWYCYINSDITITHEDFYDFC